MKVSAAVYLKKLETGEMNIEEIKKKIEEEKSTGNYICTTCKCSWKTHMHVYYRYEKVLQEVFYSWKL